MDTETRISAATRKLLPSAKWGGSGQRQKMLMPTLVPRSKPRPAPKPSATPAILLARANRKASANASGNASAKRMPKQPAGDPPLHVMRQYYDIPLDEDEQKREPKPPAGEPPLHVMRQHYYIPLDEDKKKRVPKQLAEPPTTIKCLAEHSEIPREENEQKPAATSRDATKLDRQRERR